MSRRKQSKPHHIFNENPSLSPNDPKNEIDSSQQEGNSKESPETPTSNASPCESSTTTETTQSPQEAEDDNDNNGDQEEHQSSMDVARPSIITHSGDAPPPPPAQTADDNSNEKNNLDNNSSQDNKVQKDKNENSEEAMSLESVRAAAAVPSIGQSGTLSDASPERQAEETYTKLPPNPYPNPYPLDYMNYHTLPAGLKTVTQEERSDKAKRGGGSDSDTESTIKPTNSKPSKPTSSSAGRCVPSPPGGSTDMHREEYERYMKMAQHLHYPNPYSFDYLNLHAASSSSSGLTAQAEKGREDENQKHDSDSETDSRGIKASTTTAPSSGRSHTPQDGATERHDVDDQEKYMNLSQGVKYPNPYGFDYLNFRMYPGLAALANPNLAPKLMDRTCQYCGMVKNSPADLQRHVRKHTGERPFVCEVCNKAFKAKRSLQYHQYMLHGIEHKDTNICSKFSEARKRKLEFDKDRDEHSPVHKFVKSYYVLGNENAPHQLTSSLGSSEGQGDPQRLKFWDMEDMHEESINGEGEDESKPNGDKLENMSANQGTGSELKGQQHNDSDHMKVKDDMDDWDLGLEEGQNELVIMSMRKRECLYCGKLCPKPSDMKRHLMVHTGERPYRCQVCGKGFKAKGSLLYHEKAAHNIDVELSPGLEERYRCLRANRHDNMRHPLDHSMMDPYDDDSDSEGSYSSDLPSLMKPKDRDENESTGSLNSMSATPVSFAASSSNTSVVQQRMDIDEKTHSYYEGEGHGNLENDEGQMDKLGEFRSEEFRQRTKDRKQMEAEAKGTASFRDVNFNETPNFADPKTSLVPENLRQRISIKSETVIVSRLDAINRQTGMPVSLYKCHICSKMFNLLSKMKSHLSVHFEQHMTIYQCPACDQHFKFKMQLIRHAKRHGINLQSQLSPETATAKSIAAQPNTASGATSSGITCASTTESSAGDGRGSQLNVGQDGSSAMEVKGQEDGEDGDGLSNPLSPDTADVSKPTSPGYTSADQLPSYLLSRKPMSYSCRYCNKVFFRLFSLQRHERVHTGFKPCYCRECGKGFSEPRNLRQHIIRFHSDGNQLHLIHRVRRTWLWRARQRAQRLAYVSPSQMAAAETKPGGSKKPQSDAETPPPQNPGPSKSQMVSPPIAETPEDLSMSQMKDNSLPPPPPPKEEERPAELAQVIREKEGVAEDVTVVIPSDGPIESGNASLDTPKSVASESHWSDHSLEAEDIQASSSSHQQQHSGGEIISAPHRSLMSFKPFKSKRKPATPSRFANRPDQEFLAKLQAASSGQLNSKPSESSSATDNLMGPMPSLASMGYGRPMQMSDLMALSGQLPLAAYAGKTMPVFSGVGFNPYLHTSGAPSLAVSPPNVTVLSQTPAAAPMLGSPRSLWEASLPSSSSESHDRKSGALARSHSRLDVVRTPVKREDVCKPIILPDGRAVYRCSYCNKDFGSFSDVNRHMDFHEDIRPYKCKFCDYYARTNSQLKVHMMRHQGIREFHCKLCNYKGVTQSDLNRHMKSQIHILKAQNECRRCGEGFVSPKNLEKHQEICQGPRERNEQEARHHSRLNNDRSRIKLDLPPEALGVKQELMIGQ